MADSLDQALREEVTTSTDIAAAIAELKVQLAAFENNIKIEIQAMKRDILRWMVGLAFVQVGLTVALIRFLPH